MATKSNGNGDLFDLFQSPMQKAMFTGKTKRIINTKIKHALRNTSSNRKIFQARYELLMVIMRLCHVILN